MTIPTPTSNWSDRSLKGRDFGRTAPVEPASFAPADAQGEMVSSLADHDAHDAFREPRHQAAEGRAADIWDAPLTTKADLGDPAGDTVLNAPLTSSGDLRADRRDDLLEAPLTSTLDSGRSGDDRLIDAPLTSSLTEDRPLHADRGERLADARRDAVVTPVGPAMAAAPVAATMRPVSERPETPVVERRTERSRSGGKWAWVAVPVGVAAVAGVGYLALSSGGTAPTSTEPTVNERLAMAEPAAPEALTGMGVSDLGAGAAAPAAATPPVQTAEIAPAARPAAPPVRARTTTTASEPASAPATAPAVTATTPEPVTVEPVEPPPPVSAPVIQTEPLITTEPLPLG